MSRVSWKQVGAPESALLSPAYITSPSAQLVFTSGCTGTDSAGNLPECAEQQAKNAFENLSRVLQASGSSLDAVLKVLLFVSEPTLGPIVNRVYQQYFPEKPARSCVVVAFPNPKLKVELECVAQSRARCPKL